MCDYIIRAPKRADDLPEYLDGDEKNSEIVLAFSQEPAETHQRQDEPDK